MLDVDGTGRELSYSELVRGTVQIEFSRKGEPATDAAGAGDEQDVDADDVDAVDLADEQDGDDT